MTDTDAVTGSGTADDPWVLRTPPGTSEYWMHRDDNPRNNRVRAH
jgi:hypothetical protein